MKFRITYTDNKAIEYECDEIVEIEVLDDTSDDPHAMLLDKRVAEVIPLDTAMDAVALEEFGTMLLRDFLTLSPDTLLHYCSIPGHTVRFITKHLAEYGFIPGCTATVTRPRTIATAAGGT